MNAGFTYLQQEEQTEFVKVFLYHFQFVNWIAWGQAKVYAWGSWYVSNVSTFPNTFALVLDSNLHDLNGTNPDWRCFQQNYYGAIYVQEQTFLEWPEISRSHFSENKKNTCKRWRPGSPPPLHEGGGAPAPLGRAPYLVGPLSPLRLQLQLHILSFGENKIREKKSSRFTIRSRR